MELAFGFPESLFTQHFTPAADHAACLTENETLLVRDGSKKRLLDFSTGRFCAKMALGKLEKQNYEILRGPNKEPLWPAGFVGAISHTSDLAGAVAAKSGHLAGIGLDIEKTGRVKPNMWDSLYTPAEQSFLQALSLEDKVFYTTLFFSMKESFYKLQYPLTKAALWFTDVEITSAAGGQCRLVVQKQFAGKALLPAVTELHYVCYQDLVISLCLMA